jgi:hypothetical protein
MGAGKLGVRSPAAPNASHGRATGVMNTLIPQRTLKVCVMQIPIGAAPVSLACGAITLGAVALG